MLIAQDDLDALHRDALRVNRAVIKGAFAVPEGSEAQTALLEAQTRLKRILKRLEVCGAIDEDSERRERLQDELDSIGFPDLEDPEDRRPHALELLSSPAAKRYAEACRAVAEACRVMEMERGISPDDGGFTEWLDLMARDAENEAFGMLGLRE